MQYGHFRYYWLALLASATGHQMLLQFTLGWLLYKITGEVLDLAFLGVAIAIPALILNLAGGVLADRLEPKYLVAAWRTAFTATMADPAFKADVAKRKAHLNTLTGAELTKVVHDVMNLPKADLKGAFKVYTKLLKAKY